MSAYPLSHDVRRVNQGLRGCTPLLEAPLAGSQVDLLSLKYETHNGSDAVSNNRADVDADRISSADAAGVRVNGLIACCCHPHGKRAYPRKTAFASVGLASSLSARPTCQTCLTLALFPHALHYS